MVCETPLVKALPLGRDSRRCSTRVPLPGSSVRRRRWPYARLDRGFGWTVPSEELFRFHFARIRELGGYLCGRRLYETMLGSTPQITRRDCRPRWTISISEWKGNSHSLR